MKKLLAALAVSLIPAAAFAAPVGRNVADGADTTVTAPNSVTPPAGDAQQAPSTTSTVETSNATTATTGVSTPDAAAAAETGFHLGLDLDHWLGTGTFANSAYYSYLSGNLSVAPSYAFKVKDHKLVASASTRVGVEYTRPDNETGRRVSWLDLGLKLSAPSLYKEKHTGISVSPGIGYTAPITLESIHADSFGIASVSVGLSRAWLNSKLRTSLGESLGHGIAGNTINAVTAASVKPGADGYNTVLCRSADTYCGYSNLNTSWMSITSASVSYQITKKIGVSGTYLFWKKWHYAVTDTVDQYTSPYAHAGQGSSDLAVGILGASYALNDMFSLNAGIATFAQPKTMDNKAIRFPFYDFIGPADSNTTFSLGVSAEL